MCGPRHRRGAGTDARRQGRHHHRRAPHIDPTDLWALWASVADKIVAISSILRRASRAEEELAFWAQRTAFVSRIGYFRAFCDLAGPHVPGTMRNELDHVVTRAERAIGPYR